MSEIEILDVDPELYEAARHRASVMGVTLDEYIIDLLRKDLDLRTRRDSRQEWLARAAALPRTNISVDDTLAGLDAGRSERLR